MKHSLLGSVIQYGRAFVGATIAAFCTIAVAQQPARIVVPFGAGGPPDVAARLLLPSLRAVNGINYIVDNKAGASGIIGSAEVAKARPDGSVLLITTGGHSTNAALHKNLPYDSLKDFTPLCKLLTSSGFVVLVNSKSPFRSIEELVAAAKAKPTTLSYGSSGIGNTTHLAGALFEQKVGVRMIHVPYKSGASAATTDLLGGQIDLLFASSVGAIQLVNGGKVRPLAIAGDRRLAELPEVPTLSERGFAKVEVPSWIGLFGPKGMQAEVANKIAQDFQLAMTKPEFLAALRSQPDIRIVASNPAEFRRELEEEVARLKRDLGPLGIEMQ